MRDYRISIALAIPISIALIGVLWILTKKKRPDENGKKQTKSNRIGSNSEISKTKSAAQKDLIENEGVTVTQRKIPESLARDRGSADLKLTDPDTIAGADTSENVIYNTGLNTCKPVQENETTPNEPALAQVNTVNKPEADEAHNMEVLTVNKAVCSQPGTNQPDPQENGTLPQLASTQIHLKTTEPEVAQTASEMESQMKPNKLHINCNEHLDSFSDGEELLEPRDGQQVVLDWEKSIDSMTLFEKNQVDQLVMSALGDGLLEAQSQLVIQSTNTEANMPVSTCSEKSCEFLVVEKVLTSANQESKQLSSPLGYPPVDLDTDLVFTPADATLESLTKLPEAVDMLKNTIDSCPCENSGNCCDKLKLMQVEKDCTRDLVKSCGQFNLAPCLSPTKETAADSDLTESNVSEATTSEDDSGDAGHSFEESSYSQNDNEVNLPCDNNASSSSTLISSSLNYKSVSPDPCTKYTIDWSCETATDATTYADSASTVLGSSLSSIQLSENTSLVQETNSFDTGVETSIAQQPNDTLESPTSTLNDHKQGSPTKSNSPMCDNNSEGSNDSGRGGSEHDVAGQAGENLVHFDFNMPSELCGRFIGKQGKNINFLKSKTGANVSLINNPYTADYQICQVVGSQTEIDDALAMIRRKFPLSDFPLLTMVPINLNPVATPIEHPLIVPEVMQLSLPEGVSVEVFVSAIVNAGHIFVQQPTHRSFMSLEKLTNFLNTVYGQDPNVPCVPTPVEYGIICVCENEGCWYRAMIMSPENEDGETQVKFVDYGGYAVMPVSCLKQIRTDFMSLPFQAVECFMANITPNQGEAFFSEEATMTLNTMTEYKLMQCQVVARTENGIPYIHLYQVSPESNSAVMINRALVNSSLVRWIEIL